MTQHKNYSIFVSIGLILLLGTILAIAFKPYYNAFFGALILFILFRGLHKRFTTKNKMKQGTSAISIILLTIFIALIPIFFILTIAVSQVSTFISNADSLSKDEMVSWVDEHYPSADFSNIVTNFLGAIKKLSAKLIVGAIQNTTKFFTTLTVMYFMLYFLLVNDKKVEEGIIKYLPFSEKHSTKMYNEINNITNSAVMTTGLIAIIQGTLLGVIFMIFGVPGAVTWGIAAAILSFLPVVGAPVIYIPVALYYLATGSIGTGIGILIGGLILSSIDNFIRPSMQKKFGEMHPLVSLIGVFIGIPLFGLLGIVVGPLLISYFLLSIKFFYIEFVDKKNIGN